MTRTYSFLESPEGTREEIMRATYLALCEHGYADLTIQRIGDEFQKSKSLIYHHYDGKDELLLDFLEFLLDRFEGTIPFEESDRASDHLTEVLEHVLASPLSPERREFTKAMVELRAQAAHDERFREQFTRHDRYFEREMAAIVEAGVESGEFRNVDPDAFAQFLVTVVTGVMTQRVTREDETTDAVREQLVDIVRTVGVGAG